MRRFLLCIGCLMLMLQASSQRADSLSVRMNNYAASKNAGVLFVHTDKHVYTNNEFIWFSAYLLRSGQNSLPQHRLLSVVLYQDGNPSPVLTQKFTMYAGHSYGSIQLPDSIAPGEYNMLAYTNLLGSDSIPAVSFTQPLSIRVLHTPDFTSSMNITEDSAGKKELVIVVQEKTTGLPARDAALFIDIDRGKTIVAKTDKKGRYAQALAEPTDTTLHLIRAKIKYHSGLSFLQKKLPVKKKDQVLNLRFFPEGGYLLAQAPCSVGWESRTDQDEPVPVKAVILKNNFPVDTIRTNEQGLGVFTIYPDPNAIYLVKPLNLPDGVVTSKEAFRLPDVMQEGISIQVPHAVADDSLWIHLYARGHSRIKILVHNFDTTFMSEEFSINEKGRKLLVVLSDIPKGLTAFTLLDSLNRPLAERVFFAHFNRKPSLEIELDKDIYEKREKVTIRFRLTENKAPASAIASVSCAQSNRFQTGKQQDIESFSYLLSGLQDLPAYVNGRGYNDLTYIELVMLVRGWRSYTWQEMAGSSIQKKPSYHSPVFTGKLINRYKKVKKPESVTLMGNQITILTTDSTGNFGLSYDQLRVPQDKKIWLIPNTKNMESFYVEIADPFIRINEKMQPAMKFDVLKENRFAAYSQDLVLPDTKGVKQLAEVIVTAKKNDETTYFLIANKCGDYVCHFNILNCPNHGGDVNNKAPVKGRQYAIKTGGATVYWGCVLEEEDAKNKPILQFEGIKTGKKFYGENFSENNSSKPEFISTIHWSPFLVFDKDGKAECSFYTSDITGHFRIVVNGITPDNAFFATQYFDVK